MVAGGMLIYYRNHPVGRSAPVVITEGQQSVASANWATKTNDQASVTVVVTPIDLSAKSQEWKFDIGMNTHSVELDQDMTRSGVLIDDSGKTYKPIRWDGAPGGGHHREGVLVFSPISHPVKTVSLIILGIGGVERGFTWQL